MALLGFVIALVLFFHFRGRLRRYRRRQLRRDAGAGAPGAARWNDEWHREWVDKFQRQAERRRRQIERHAQNKLRRLDRAARRLGLPGAPPAPPDEPASESTHDAADADVMRRARRRAAAEVGFFVHAMSYLGVIAFLALVNAFTTHYPWFLWPALGWGIGLFSHYMAVFGSRVVRERYFDPAVEREVRREKLFMQTEKQASIDELSSTIAHEIRNPIAAAKSLVQQIGEDPKSVENVEYAKVALEELDRVERSISHLLKYAKEEDFTFVRANLTGIVDSALTQMRAKLDAAGVAVARNYISGPTILADPDKLRQVFTNILDNAIDALEALTAGRRIDLFIENGTGEVTVRVRDNGCGIPADKIGRIFNPFFTTKEKGTGLGMAVARKTVEAHEGRIDVVSEPGRGTEFAVSLPLQR